jgi:hypothetical protein
MRGGAADRPRLCECQIDGVLDREAVGRVITAQREIGAQLEDPEKLVAIATWADATRESDGGQEQRGAGRSLRG